MDDFTSTGLASLLVRAITDTDPSLLDGIDRPDPMHRAIMPDAAKRTLIARVLEKHGPGPLLRVGQYLDRAEESPVLTVLTASTGPAVLAEKWMRLERYHHASHRTLIAPDGARAWHCRRQGGATPPQLGENCLIAGLLLGLVRAIGVTGSRLHIAGQTFLPAQLADAAFPQGETAVEFGIAWSGEAPVPIAAAGDEASALDARLADLLAGDMGRGWRLGDAARGLACSERSLQRHLAARGRSFSSVLRQARMRVATLLLTKSPATLAEIGYCCGYADQAHFQRDFLRATNMTPRIFREAVAGRPGALPR